MYDIFMELSLSEKKKLEKKLKQQKLEQLVKIPNIRIFEICDMLKVTDVTVRNWLKELNIKFDGKQTEFQNIKLATIEAIKNNKYNVIIKEDTYINKNANAVFIDPVYGEFIATPTQIIRNQKVHPSRKGKAKTFSIDAIKKKIATIHKGIVSIKEDTYINGNIKCTFIDMEYGEWEAKPLKVVRGTGHPLRANKTISLKKSKSLDQIKQSLPSRLSIDESTFIQSTKPAKFIDSEYGEFWQKPNYVLRTNGHPKRTTAVKKQIKLMSVEQINNRLKVIKPHLSIKQETYINTHTKCTFIDEKYGEWETMPYPVLYSDVDHPSRNKSITRPQQEVFEFIQSLGFTAASQNTTPIAGSKKQIDIYIPEKNLGIEYNGIYYHTVQFKNKNDHWDKRIMCEQSGITLIQITSEEWSNKKDICKSIIKSKLGLLGTNINGRDCQIKELGVGESEEFLRENHLMGGQKTAKRMGLYHNGILVSLMTYKIVILKGIKTLDIVRFANRINYNVRGSLSKLLKAVVSVTNPEAIQSFVDLRYGTGFSLTKIGFTLESTTLSYKWADKRQITYNRLKCRANMDERKLTEKQHAEELCWQKIYDAGQAKFVKKLV